MTGQDGLRDEIAVIIREHIFGNDMPSDEANCCADAVLPVVQRHIDAAREQVADAEAATTRMFGLVNHARVERDAAVARAEQAEQWIKEAEWRRQILLETHERAEAAEQALARVRELLARLEHMSSPLEER